jgi:hypothetical protein
MNKKIHNVLQLFKYLATMGNLLGRLEATAVSKKLDKFGIRLPLNFSGWVSRDGRLSWNQSTVLRDSIGH